MDNKINIIIPVYNSEKWIGENIDSILNQSYGNWEAIIINDASTDRTYEIILDKVKGNEKFTVINRDENVGSLANLVLGTNTLCTSDDDIILTVDGDDWLYSNTVLEYINNVYNSGNILVTHGSYVHLSDGGIGGWNSQIPTTTTYRMSGHWCTSHLRTYKYILWKNIREDDFMIDGEYMKSAGDLAIMYPIVELAGNDRIKFITEPLYVYNDVNPLCDHRVSVELQQSIAGYIRTLPTYRVLDIAYD